MEPSRGKSLCVPFDSEEHYAAYVADPESLRQMLAEALRIGHVRCIVLFTIERHTETLSSGWFHGSDSLYGAVCSMHSIGLEVESSYCLHRFSTNHEIRWNQRYSTPESLRESRSRWPVGL